MVYYNDNELMIRNMEEADARVFTDEEIAQGWHTDISKYLARLQDQSAGKCVSLTAVYKGLCRVCECIHNRAQRCVQRKRIARDC